MKRSLFTIGLLYITLNIYSQVDLEVDGKVKLNVIEKNNQADSLVVRQSDGILAIRDASTLKEYQTLRISNDTIYLTNGGFVKLPAALDGSTTNELQTISRSGMLVSLSNNGGSYQDSVLTEATVDAMISDNGYLIEEVDGSIINELQTIRRTGSMVTLSDGGGSYQDSVLTESDVDAMVADNGYLISEADGSISNELQTISRTGMTVTLSDGGGSYQDSVLTESDVDAMVADNGYLISEVDGSISNELQTISRTGMIVTLSDGGGSYQDSVLTESDVDAMVADNGYLSSEADGSSTNELQTISRTGTTVTLSNGGGSYQDSVLSEASVGIMIGDDIRDSISTMVATTLRDTSTAIRMNVEANRVKAIALMDSLSSHRNDLTQLYASDTSTTNELQTISKMGSVITLSNNGGSVTDAVLSESTVDMMVSNNGYITSELDAGWVQDQDSTTTDNLVGIGTTAPEAELHVIGNIKIVDGNQGDRRILTSDADGLASWTAEVPPTAQPIPLKYHGNIIYVYPTDSATDVDWTSAKAACAATNDFGHSDWYLPSLSELNAMYKQSYLITGLDETANAKYWSNTEKDATNSYTLRLDYGGPDPDSKISTTKHNARCIRKN